MPIFVIVRNGEASVQQDTVPADVSVEIIDLDLIRAGDSFPSKAAFDYCQDKDLFQERRKAARDGTDPEKQG